MPIIKKDGDISLMYPMPRDIEDLIFHNNTPNQLFPLTLNYCCICGAQIAIVRTFSNSYEVRFTCGLYPPEKIKKQFSNGWSLAYSGKDWVLTHAYFRDLVHKALERIDRLYPTYSARELM